MSLGNSHIQQPLQALSGHERSIVGWGNVLPNVVVQGLGLRVSGGNYGCLHKNTRWPGSRKPLAKNSKLKRAIISPTS